MLANILDGIMNIPFPWAPCWQTLWASPLASSLARFGTYRSHGVALLIPLTFGMPAVEAFSALLGMYVGAIYGGCICHSRRHAGYGVAAATMLEGPALTARGESRGLWTWLP